MQNQTLKAFYYGNLFPAERRMVQGSEATRAMRELTDAEARLSQSIPPGASIRPGTARQGPG